jgi:hypothetical protein
MASLISPSKLLKNAITISKLIYTTILSFQEVQPCCQVSMSALIKKFAEKLVKVPVSTETRPGLQSKQTLMCMLIFTVNMLLG